MLRRVSRDEGVLIGGSFLCRDLDGEVRNAFCPAGPSGLVGRHDKDLPTMWENALYAGGDDDGVIHTDGITIGAAVCWEYMRSATARRLRGRVDLASAGELVELPGVTYRGAFQGGAQIADAQGRVLARRESGDGSCFAIAAVPVGRTQPVEAIPDRYWLHPRGAIGAITWTTQRALGRRWYARNVRGRRPCR